MKDDVRDAVPEAQVGACEAALSAVVHKSRLQNLARGQAIVDQHLTDNERLALVGGLDRGKERKESLAEGLTCCLRFSGSDARVQGAAELSDAIEDVANQRGLRRGLRRTG